MRSRYLARKIVVPVIDRAGVFRLTRRLGQGHRVTLNYHNVEPDVFRLHAAFLHAMVDVVDIEHVSDANSKRLKVGLTFDDGYRRFAEEIIPILSEFDFPATWFVPTANVGSEQVLWFDRVRAAIRHTSRRNIRAAGCAWALRNWNREEVAEAVTGRLKRLDDARRQSAVADLVGHLGEPPQHLLQSLQIVTPPTLSELPSQVTVGSHSHTHPQLTHLDDEMLTQDLSMSRRLLEGWTGRPVRRFAYPSGDYDERVVRAVQDAGYAQAWTTETRFHGLNENQYQMPRVPIGDRASVSVLSAKLTFWVHQVERLRA